MKKTIGMKKWTVIFLILIICIFLIISFLLILRLRHGVKVKPDNDGILTKTVICYRQDEESWAMDSLGDSSYTMKSSGCLVACIASAISAGDEPVTYTNVGVIDPVDNKDFEMQDWQEAYAAYIEEEDKDGYYTYSLIYVNGDDIPELVIDTGGEAGGCEILTFYNGEIDVLQTDRLEFYYIERQNLLNNAAGNTGFYYDYIYSIENGKWVSQGIGEYYEFWPEDVTDYSDIIFIYEWNGKRVDEEKYQKSVNAIFDMEQAIEPQQYDIPGEMVSRLRTGEVLSAKHRYELFVGDVTWDEARAFCEERGGYLATLITAEEYERIQNCIEENDLTDMMFWVGSDGYDWLEPGEELNRYYILGHYNALWRFAYNEPNYEGGVYLFYDADRQQYLLADVSDDSLSLSSNDSPYAGKIGFICEYDE